MRADDTDRWEFAGWGTATAPPEELMHFLQGFDVRRYRVEPSSSLAGRTLAEAGLAGIGLLVIGIERSGSFIGTPSGETTIEVDDRLIAYGKLEILEMTLAQ